MPLRLSQDTNIRPVTGLLVLEDGTVLEGQGFGAVGEAVGEVCFNTAMTGYQEILTDPSYAAQIVTFTFPHIGNVGVNDEDIENAAANAAIAARGAIVRADVTAPSNHRARMDLEAWMRRRGIIGLTGVDTRALTVRIREQGMPKGVIAHNPNGRFDRDRLIERAKAWHGLEGLDLAKEVSTERPFVIDGDGPHVVLLDFGVKRNILNRLKAAGCKVTVVPAKTGFDEIMAAKPDGVVLSNGPGDPAATAQYAVPVIQKLMEARVPMFGICLGHQLMALAVGATTVKMAQGHHGANHPVLEHETGKVEIVSMNHGFAVDEESLPDRVESTYTSLFDGTNAGIRVKDAPALAVQHHPEASPGPQDSFPVFDRFVELMLKEKSAA
ncbi:carbamoyl-phosphate synthase small chain [Parvularcula lutaonensis]|nr:glutamine-hydrolyzing carbamoyl-phosphate synthase small subunit [Parvularcula lutaonensis]GGY40003.1 carbamoyl-phosphate synthase small chain [Parvularcula lutaonensis]